MDLPNSMSGIAGTIPDSSSSRGDPTHAKTPQPKYFWPAAIALTLAIYWVCLRFLFPGYFEPLSPFHLDFYDYVAASQRTFLQVLLRFPRPVSYETMKLLGSMGLSGLMAGELAIALGNVLLTLCLVRRLFRFYSPWLLASLPAYLFLLFAHPEFYFEHRHDLPAESPT